MKRTLAILAALVLIAAPVAAQQEEFIPPAGATVFDVMTSDGTELQPTGSIYCLPETTTEPGWIPPADTVVMEFSISDGLTLLPVTTLYCLISTPR